MRRGGDYLITMGALSLLTVTYEVVALSNNVAASERLLELSSLLSLLLLVMWVDLDSRTRPEIYRPFEYGWLALLFWIPYLPYYFWRTRGIQGVLMFLGLLAIMLAAQIVQVVYYVAR
jgi:hypothetical protein